MGGLKKPPEPRPPKGPPPPQRPPRAPPAAGCDSAGQRAAPSAPRLLPSAPAPLLSPTHPKRTERGKGFAPLISHFGGKCHFSWRNSSYPHLCAFPAEKEKFPARPLGRPKADGWLSARLPPRLREADAPSGGAPRCPPPPPPRRRRASGPGTSALAWSRSTAGGARVSGAAQQRSRFRRCPGHEGGGGRLPQGGAAPQATRTCPRQQQNDTRGFVGSVVPSEAASFKDCKENTVLQSL